MTTRERVCTVIAVDGRIANIEDSVGGGK